MDPSNKEITITLTEKELAFVVEALANVPLTGKPHTLRDVLILWDCIMEKLQHAVATPRK